MMDQDYMRVNSCWRRVQARGLAVKMPHPEAGEVPLVASPIRLSKTPVEYRRAPPLVGEHTDEILADLGVDAAGIAGLRERGGVGPLRRVRLCVGARLQRCFTCRSICHLSQLKAGF